MCGGGQIHDTQWLVPYDSEDVPNIALEPRLIPTTSPPTLFTSFSPHRLRPFSPHSTTSHITSDPVHQNKCPACLPSEPDGVDASAFAEVNYVDITATGKGRGFQGVVKRYNFGGGRASHGGGWIRRTGSIGMCEFPGRVFKGKKMPGQMGDKRVTTQNLKVIQVRPEENLILIKGSVPGAKGGIVTINEALKKK